MHSNKVLAVDARHLKSGIGTYLKQLLPAMVKQSNWQWKIIGPNYWEFLDSDKVEWMPCEYGIYSLREHFLIPKLASGADMLWVPQYNAPEMWQGRLVVTLHDLIHCMKEYPRPAFKSFLGRQIMNWALKKSEAIITVSEYSKNKLGEFFPSHLSKVEVIHNGVQAIPKKTGLSPIEGEYILSFGNALAHKNFPRLIEAFLKVKDRLSSKLVIAGFDGSDSKVMRSMAAKDPERVLLLPPQKNEAWANLMYHAKLYVCPSLEEGFGLPPFEALSAGIPVAVARAASLPEVLGKGAFWFDPRNVEDMAETLVKACLDNEQRARVLTMGQERLQQFSWDKSVRRHLDLFQRLFDL